jgi:hypothetical protein
MTYREMPDVLGENERDAEATRMFGAWRDRTKTIVLVIGAAIGLVVAGMAYWFVQELQFRYNHGVALVKVNVLAVIAAWLVVFFASSRVARVVVVRRTPAKLDELAKAYEIPVAKLTEIANLVKKL